jgi:hypothetical protein
LIRNTAKRLKNKAPRLITSDEHKPYKKAILKAFGEKRVPKRTGRRGRPKGPRYRPKKDLVYATVHKTREKGRVTDISYRIVFGTEVQVADALKSSRCSRHINTSFIERHNGTDRNRCSRKVRKSYCFSKCLSIFSGIRQRIGMFIYSVRHLRVMKNVSWWSCHDCPAFIPTSN